jgi:D-glycero-alpha-D-manno-heptose 1-phosphate guanylyltransferase
VKTDAEEPVLVVNGDTYFTVQFPALESAYRDHGADWCVSLFRTTDGNRYMSVEVLPDGRVVSFKTENYPKSHLANGGVYIVGPNAIDWDSYRPSVAISLENDIFTMAIKSDKRFYGFKFEANFIDIGVPDDY